MKYRFNDATSRELSMCPTDAFTLTDIKDVHRIISRDLHWQNLYFVFKKRNNMTVFYLVRLDDSRAFGFDQSIASIMFYAHT